MKKFKNFKENIAFFKKVSLKKNEYFCKKKYGLIPNENPYPNNPENRIPINGLNTFHSEGLVEKIEMYSDSNSFAKQILKEKAIERFHPNNINNKEFWVECRKNFPLVSVSGAPSKNIAEVNEKTMEIPLYTGILDAINTLIESSKTKLSMLEIGFGYGNMFFELKDKLNYTGIDYIVPNTLKKYKNFIEINQSGIPDYFLDENLFDIVYSVNVLQHCSQDDRFEYIRQAYRALKSGGHMIFTMFLITQGNKNGKYWGCVDNKGRAYTQFFNQLTECDWDWEFDSFVRKVGFTYERAEISGNFFTCILKKN